MTKISKKYILIVLIVAVVAIFLFGKVRENYDSNYPGATMNLVQVNIDSTNNMSLRLIFSFEPAIDPTLPTKPMVYPTISNVTVIDKNLNTYTVVAPYPKSVPPTLPIDQLVDVQLPANIDRTTVQQVTVSGYINFSYENNWINTPTVTDTSSDIKLN